MFSCRTCRCLHIYGHTSRSKAANCEQDSGDHYVRKGTHARAAARPIGAQAFALGTDERRDGPLVVR
eukprot:scaffold3042_cov313-Prasinococcus_capsulatus_cf.AAC.2